MTQRQSEQLDRWLDQYEEEGFLTLSCGCEVEPDGECEHGNESPFIGLGIV